MHIKLTVNGEPRELLAPASATLLEVLRGPLELTGTKRGCNHGVCGACTVLLDGKLARACLTLALDVGERPVTTVEAFSELSAVQRALIDSGAIQCGFCTPGFVMAARDLLRRVPDPSAEEIREGLNGNLCRCTGYQNIVDAVLSLSR